MLALMIDYNDEIRDNSTVLFCTGMSEQNVSGPLSNRYRGQFDQGFHQSDILIKGRH